MAHLVALQTTEAVNPSSNPASPTVDKNSNEDRQGHCVYFKISCAFVIRQIVYSSVPVLIRQVSTLFRVVNSVKVSIFLTDCGFENILFNFDGLNGWNQKIVDFFLFRLKGRLRPVPAKRLITARRD